MHRFFSHNPLTDELALTPGNQFHQIYHVFRAKKGDSLIFFEDGGHDIIYEVIEVSRKKIRLKKIRALRKPRKKERSIEVYLAYPNKATTMEIVIQKIVELGIDKIVFFASDRSQIKSIIDSKKLRLSAIALEALEQSGWNKVLEISYSPEKKELLWRENAHNIVGSIDEKIGLDIPDWDDSLWFWVWPEGWWSEDEKDFFKKNNGILWSFNPNVLRLETASVAGVWILRYLSQIEK